MREQDTIPPRHGQGLPPFPIREGGQGVRLFSYLILLLAFALRVFRLGYQSIWWDEGYSIAISSTSLAEATRATATDIHPPLYYYLLHFWMQAAGQSEFAVRFLSAALGVVLAASVMSFGSRLLGPRLGVVGAFLTAISPLHVAYGQETRMYTLETLLSLASAYLLFVLLAAPGSRLVWAVYVFTTALALYADYFPVEVVVFEGIFVLGWVACNWRRTSDARRFLFRWCLSQAAVVLLYVPWLGIALGQVAGYGFGAVSAPPILSLPADIWRVLALGAQFAVPGETSLLYTVGAIFIAGLAVRLLRQREFPLLFLLCYLLVTLGAFVVALQFRPFYHPRYFLVTTPAYYLLLAAALGGLWRLRSGLGVLGWAALAGSSILVLNAYYFDPALAKDDARSAMAFVNQEAEEDDLVLWVTPHPYQYYYRGRAAARTLKVDPLTAAGELSALGRGKKRVFWVVWRYSHQDPWELAPFLLRKDGRQLGARDFTGYRVLWYATPPEGFYRLLRGEDREVNFEDALLLNGFQAEVGGGSIAGGEPLSVTLTWRSLKSGLAEDLKAYVHIKDSKGNIVGQDDRFLYNLRRLPTRFWREGEIAYSFAAPVIKPGTPRGEYQVEVGVYSEKTKQRLKAAALRGPGIGATIQVGPSFVAPPLDSAGVRHSADKDFGPLTLLGYGLGLGDKRKVEQGETLSITLLWRAKEKPTSDLQAGLTLADKEGNVVGARPFHPAGYPTSQWGSGEVVVDKEDFQAPSDIAPGAYQLAVAVGDLPAYSLGEIQILKRPRSFRAPAVQYPSSIKVGDSIEFLGFDVKGGARDGQLFSLRPGEELTLALHWRSLAPTDRVYTVFTHVADAENRIWGQHDGPPDGGASPSNTWLPGQVVSDKHTIVLKKEAPLGRYTLSIGMYEAAANVRLTTEGGENRIVLGTVEVAGQ
ncbi:MAG: glycosyltransferase family 39 protein [Chloroflexi bacterium]|nr:glycosyltransferase family 39 protein [Chloroflexota bacterium]